MGVDDEPIIAHEANLSTYPHTSRRTDTERRPKANAKPKNASNSQKAN